MAPLSTRYFNTLIERMEKVRDTQCEAIEKAAEMCARSIGNGKLAFTFGTGHGAIPALESFPRTGTIVGFRPIVESTMISFHHVWGDMGARQYRYIHAQEGYGRAIMASHQTDPGDSMILFSHSGINAVILDIAMECKERGIGVIAVTSLPHSSSVPSRHSCGKRLYEVADVVIDTGIPKGDASLQIDGLKYPVGASSTSVTIAIAHAIVSTTAERLVAQGIEPGVMVSPNTTEKAEADAQNDSNYQALWQRLKDR
ncbi:sugar isomerase domain-containing protein [Pseudooceanicola spongiae]|uniref:Sugar isomerase domain-containing protein n=1 Tax=Pseudooceanicola spongiae TaxID=2613965 RepID=A0A7M3V2U8_9RHOB|nr:SIS domain-containing protein [Pseudooceanicola spongiae]QOL79411.1 sugar isomerase domain-containing protein [Pseudooceanicola spongiae]